MNERAKKQFSAEIKSIKESGFWKDERILTSPQAARVGVLGNRDVLNMCANNYLGLSNHPEVIKAAKESYDKW